MFHSDPFIHLLDDPWAPHPVVNRHVCNGGGGGDEGPQVPDYSNYITAMSNVGNQGQTWAREMYDWAKQQGLDLTKLTSELGAKAGAAGDKQQQRSDEDYDYWRSLSRPLYDAQQKEALRLGADLPATMESYAGKYGADAAIGIDQQKAALQRKMLAEGTAGGRPGIASQALDTMASIGRAAAVTAASEAGRGAARTEARDAVTGALKDEQYIGDTSARSAGLATANRGQAGALPIAGSQAASSLYTPAVGMYSASVAPLKEWGDTMKTGYNQNLARYEAGADDSTASDVLGLAGGIAGTVAGGYFGGPAGAMAGGSLGSSIGGKAGKALAATGGKIMGRRVPRGYAAGGAINTSAPGEGNMVTPDMSPSGGQEVDDVPAMVSEGEFVIPERTVDWFGEKYFQNLIAKSDKDREMQTVAAPEEGPPEQGISMEAPIFRSEGARV